LRHRLVLVFIALSLLTAAACDSAHKTDSGPPVNTAAVMATPTRRTPTELQREKVLSSQIKQLLENEHIRKKPVDNEVSRAAFAEYLKSLDPTRVFLLQKDVDALTVHADTMDDELAAGRLTLAELGEQLQNDRIRDAQAMIDKALVQPFDFTNEETLETDGEKRPWCATEAELAERWRKVLELQALQRIERAMETDKALAEAATAPPDADAGTPNADGADAGTPTPPPVAKDFATYEKEARERLQKDYSSRFSRLLQQEHIDEVELFLNAITTIYDPHTTYLAPAQKENFDIQMSGSLEGIGATLQEHESLIKVVSIVPGSASWRQGELEAEDLIMAVAQVGQEPVDVMDMRLRDVVKMIRGPKGTTVTLTIKKPDASVKVISIVRDVVRIEESFAKGAVLTHPKLPVKVGYIDLPSFYGNTRAAPGETPDRHCTDDVAKLLKAFNARGIHHVILDLRGNGGGLLSDAQRMSGLFIKDGSIVQTRDNDGDVKVLEDPDSAIAYDGQLIVMVDSLSASASEILAGAMQDYKRAVIVGTTQTHGKGTVQQLLNLDRMASMDEAPEAIRPLGVFKISLQQFFRVNGDSTQHRGVIPDIQLADPWAYIETGERYYPHSIPWSQADAVSYDTWPKPPALASLKQRSEVRQATNDAFKRVKSRTTLLASRKDQTLETLNRDAWLKQRDTEKKELDALTVEFDKEPVRFKAEQLDYDGAIARQKAQAASPEGKDRKTGQDAPDRFGEGLGKDPWVEEALFILGDMGQ